jgi:hypothetical protein
MKNIKIYFLTILTPLIAFIFLYKTKSIESTYSIVFFFFYLLFFKTYIDGRRLSEKNIISKKDIWKLIIPGTHLKYFKDLYLS